MKTENNTQKHNTLHISTREEFHRYASNIINEEDFCTDYPGYAGYQVDRVSSALRWTIANGRAINYSFNKRNAN